MIRADLTLLADPTADVAERVPAPLGKHARAEQTAVNPLVPRPFPRRLRRPGRGRAAGQGDPLFAAGAGLALLDSFLRDDPPAAEALRSRLALQSAAAAAKILRLNADAAALRDLRFAISDDSGPRRGCGFGGQLPADRPSLDPGRILDVAAARFDLALPPKGQFRPVLAR